MLELDDFRGLLKEGDVDKIVKAALVVGFFFALAMAWRALMEYTATQQSTRQFHRDNLVAQKAHLDAHAGLRKHLVALAAQGVALADGNRSKAVDLLAQLEQGKIG